MCCLYSVFIHWQPVLRSYRFVTCIVSISTHQLPILGVLFILLVFPHTSGLYLGFVSMSFVFPHTMDLLSDLVIVSFVLLVFPHTGVLFQRLAGVLYVELLAFLHTGDLFSVCCFLVSVSMHQWPVLGSCKCVACVSKCYGLVLRLVERQESVEQSQTASIEYVSWHGGVTILCCWANQMLHHQHQSHLCVSTTSGSMAS